MKEKIRAKFQAIARRFKVLKDWFYRLPKFQRILVGATALLAVFLILGFGVNWLLSNKNTRSPYSDIEVDKSNDVKVKEVEAPKDHENPLTGQKITQAKYDKLLLRKPLSVMIENHTEARPQSGLSKADRVYEALAEGGISRFLVVFFTNDADVVGPVRSARRYYLDWSSELAQPYGALYAHIGGASSTDPGADAYGLIQSEGILSLDQFWVGAPTYWRSTDRYSPHNVYTSTQGLYEAANSRWPEEWTVPKSIPSWIYADFDAKKAGDVLGVHIQFGSWSYPEYFVDWAYDSSQQFYLRSNAGEPQADLENSQPLTAQNVVIQYTNTNVSSDGTAHLAMSTLGEGKVEILRNGERIEGLWKKATRTSQTKYVDLQGRPIQMMRGVTWVEIVPADSVITYQTQVAE